MKYEEIIKKGLSMGISELEIHATTTEGNTLKLFNGNLESNNQEKLFSVTIRGLVNGKMAYVSTESVKEKDIDLVLNRLIENANSLTTTEKEFIFDGNCHYQDVVPLQADYNNFDTSKKIALLKKMEESLLNYDKRIKQVGLCSYSENKEITEIVNSKGVNLKRENSYLYSVIGALATDGENNTVGYASDINSKLDDLEIERMVKEAADDAINSLGAKGVNTGYYPIVFHRDVATEILEAFASIFSGESAMNKMSIITDKIGKKIFGDNITILDDPFYEDAILKINFDDEAVPCMKKEIVKNGVFNGFIHSLKTANYFNTSPTGNGFYGGGGISPSPINFVLKPGDLTKDQIINSVEKGIYVTQVQGLHAGLNPISGDFNVQASGFMISNGKLDYPVTLFVISGNFFDLMNNIELIGNDIRKRFLGYASPTIKINKLMVSGK